MPIHKDLKSEDQSDNSGKTKGSRTHVYMKFLLVFSRRISP
jgi:hypothetical protein